MFSGTIQNFSITLLSNSLNTNNTHTQSGSQDTKEYTGMKMPTNQLEKVKLSWKIKNQSLGKRTGHRDVRTIRQFFQNNHLPQWISLDKYLHTKEIIEGSNHRTSRYLLGFITVQAEAEPVTRLQKMLDNDETFLHWFTVLITTRTIGNYYTTCKLRNQQLMKLIQT